MHGATARTHRMGPSFLAVPRVLLAPAAFFVLGSASMIAWAEAPGEIGLKEARDLAWKRIDAIWTEGFGLTDPRITPKPRPVDLVHPYPIELLDRVFTLYEEGVPNERVTKTVCRDYALRLLRDMFAVDNESQKDEANRALSNDQRVRLFLDEATIPIFRARIVDWLASAHADLSPASLEGYDDATAETIDRLDLLAARYRRVLIHFSGWVLVSPEAVADPEQKAVLARVPDLLSSFYDDLSEDQTVIDAARVADERIARGYVDVEARRQSMVDGSKKTP